MTSSTIFCFCATGRFLVACDPRGILARRVELQFGFAALALDCRRRFSCSLRGDRFGPRGFQLLVGRLHFGSFFTAACGLLLLGLKFAAHRRRAARARPSRRWPRASFSPITSASSARNASAIFLASADRCFRRVSASAAAALRYPFDEFVDVTLDIGVAGETLFEGLGRGLEGGTQRLDPFQGRLRRGPEDLVSSADVSLAARALNSIKGAPMFAS